MTEPGPYHVSLTPGRRMTEPGPYHVSLTPGRHIDQLARNLSRQQTPGVGERCESSVRETGRASASRFGPPTTRRHDTTAEFARHYGPPLPSEGGRQQQQSAIAAHLQHMTQIGRQALRDRPRGSTRAGARGDTADEPAIRARLEAEAMTAVN